MSNSHFYINPEDDWYSLEQTSEQLRTENKISTITQKMKDLTISEPRRVDKLPVFSRKTYKNGDIIMIIGQKQPYKGYHAVIRNQREEKMRMTVLANGINVFLDNKSILPLSVYYEIIGDKQHIVVDRHLREYRKKY